MNDSREFTSPRSVSRKAGVLKPAVCVVYAACLAVTGIVSASQSRPTPPAGSAQAPEIARLLGALKQEQWTDWLEPQAAAHKLAEVGGPAVRPIFKAMVASNSNRALHWMEYALYRMAEQYAARQDDPQSPAEILLAALDDRRESYDLRRLSARLLGKLGDGRAVPVLEKNLADRRVAMDAARSLGQLRTTDSRQALMRHLSVADQALKLEIITSLGQLGDARALPALERVAASRVAELRVAALEAAARIRSPRTLALLKQRAARETDPQVRKSLRLGFLRQGQTLPPTLTQLAATSVRNISCQGCHAQLYTDFLTSAHSAKARLTCITCHGESIEHQDSYGSQRPERTYAGASVAPMCAQCHQQMDLRALELTPGNRLRHTFSALSRSHAVGSAGVSGAITSYAESFERGAAVGWEPVNPEDWRVLRDRANFVYALTRPGASGVPRRPIQISLLRERTFGDFTLTCRVRRPDPKMKSLVLVFGYQDEMRFYYAHLSADSSEQARVHNGLFIVDGAPRRRIGTLDAAAILPDTDWHRIRIEREARTGRIALYADDARKPVQEAVDHRFHSGRIGLGSFGEVGYFDAILIK